MGRRILDPARRSELRTPQKRLAGLVARVQAIDPRTLDVFPLQGLSTAWGADTTGGAFGAVWQALATRVSHPAMFVRLAWATGAGTTGEIRVVATGPGGSVTSSVLSLGAASSSTDVLGWQPGLDVWLSGALTVNVEVRRTGGANNVTTFRPQVGLIDPRGCTAGGGTWVSGGWLPGWT